MRAGFQTRFCDVVTTDFRLFALQRPVDYVSLAGVHYQCAAGSQTDLASIPRAMWNLLPPAGDVGAEYALAAVLHDCAYKDRLNIVDQWDAVTKASLSKDAADSLLLEAMLACGVPSTKAEIIYAGVRYGGQHAFNEDRGL